MPAQHHGYRDLSESEIEDALGYLDPNMVRAEWAVIGMAIKSELGEGGLAMFDRWSRRGDNYEEAAVKDTWRSISASGGITIATLIAKAIQEGFAFDEANRTPISQADIERRERERREREEAEAKVKAAKREAAAVKANAIWNAAEDIEGDEHPYLKRKGVLAHGVRVGTWKNIPGYLLIPMRTPAGDIVSLQAISSNPDPTVGRAKDFLYEGQKHGTMHWIGDVPNDATVIIVVTEGYATGGSIHLATGYSVAVAWDAGNLPTVAMILRKLHPRATIIVAAENDKYGKANAGLKGAQQACTSARALMALPKFRDESSQPTDFNDLALLEGLDAVRGQINSVLPKADNDNELEDPTIDLDGQADPFGYPHKTEKHQPLNTWENLGWLLKQYGITAKYNQVRKQVEVVLPGRDYSADNRANCSLAELTSICVRNRMPQSHLQDYVKLIAEGNRYNPVADWITGKPWDGVTRIQQLLDTVQTTGDTKLKDALIYRWLLSCVAAAFMPHGFEGHGCLVFTGAQGVGKTTWFRRLAPSDMGLVLVGAMLDPNNKDTVTNAVSHWIVELGELDATFRKADIARLKSFIPLPVDKLRRPYDRVESEYQRRTVFCASVNETHYLVDDTGNRRWWTVNVSGIDYQHSIDMQQLWAEILVRFQAGEQHYLTREENEALGQLNEQHELIDPVEEQIVAAFDWDKPSVRPVEMTASEVLVAIGYDKPTRAQATQASNYLRKLTGKEPRRSGKGRFFSMPSAPKMRSWGKPQQQQQDDDRSPF
jgi:putative DNA primase/helicase